MDTDSSGVFQRISEPLDPKPQPQRKPLTFTTEEFQVMRECNRESFYYRCLPFSLVGMGATYLAVRAGYLNAHPKWGAVIKMTGAAFCGWFFGKLSYRSVCEDKFLRLEKSNVGDLIRRKRGYSPAEALQSEFIPDDSFESGAHASTDTEMGYHSSSGSLNLDTDKNPQFFGLDDRERPTTDSNPTFESEDKCERITYNELRRKHRDDHKKGIHDDQRDNQYFMLMPRKSKDSKLREDESENSYADTWDTPKYV